jgi:hypothetical protein
LDCHWIKDYVKFHLYGTTPQFVNRISSCVQFWKNIGAKEWLVDIIENGVKIPFAIMPPRIRLKNNPTALSRDNIDWVRNTLNEYQRDGFIEQVSYTPYCVMPLQIKDNGTKKSLIFDMSKLNDYVLKSSFKLESWPEMLDYCMDAQYAIKFDMKKYYYQIKLSPDEYTYYGFAFQMADGEPERYFIWKSLPYGYTRAPYIAKELMKPLIAKWRRLGGRIVVFYDDGMSVHKDYHTLMALGVQMQCDLLNAGLIPGIEKCSWQPVVNIDWNGLSFDFKQMQISILEKRIAKALTLIDTMILKFPDFTYREVAKLVGTLISMASVFVGVSQIFTRNMQTFVNIRHCDEQDWDEKISADYGGLYAAMYDELLFWKRNLRSQNSRDFVQRRPKWIGWTDASDYACGGFVV